MSNIVEVTELDELWDILKDNSVVVVDFQAPAWCIPCRRFAPHFESAASQSDAVFVTVDVDIAPWAMTDLGIQSVPTVKLYRDGEFVGNLQSRTAVALLNEIRE